MGAQVKQVIHPSPWDHYDKCKICGVAPGAPCLDLRRVVAGRFLYLRVQPHIGRALEDTWKGPKTWPDVGQGYI